MRRLLSLSLCLTAACNESLPSEEAPDLASPGTVVAAPFRNLDFEDIDESGIVVGWRCLCGAATPGPCRESNMTVGRDSKRALVIEPGCRAFQQSETFDPALAIQFSLESRATPFHPNAASLYGVNDGIMVDRVGSDPGATQADGWQKIASAGVVATNGSTRLVLDLVNQTIDPMRIDNLVVTQPAPNPLPAAATLLTGTHRESVVVHPGATDGTLYTPLPIDFATQVPLFVELTTTPTGIVDRIEYVAEDEGNWGALLHFAPEAAAARVELAWDAVVLTRSINDAERPLTYAAISDPARWLVATPIADAALPAIAENATLLVGADATPLAKLVATVDFTSSYITNEAPLTALDATTAWTSRSASCTGYTNLASATGRALGVPVRHVSNVLVGVTQQLHAINEFYLGAELGWRRVEPQVGGDRVPETYGLIMRLHLPEDENDHALASRAWVMGGAPLRAFTEPVVAPERFAPLGTDAFRDCPGCLNRADEKRQLRTDASAMQVLFLRARTAWQFDRAVLATRPLSPARQEARRALSRAIDATDFATKLSALEAIAP